MNNRTKPGQTHTAYHQVLVVDDNPGVVAAVAARLYSIGWECLTAINGHDAMQMLANHSVQAVITDLDMPNIDGFQILKAATTYKSCPAAVITGSAEAAQRCQADFPSIPVLMKPFKSDLIVNFIRSVENDLT